jgi:farnesyl-diphosphate farnesyltransferase
VNAPQGISTPAASHAAGSGLPAVTEELRRRLLTTILKDVSRAFYLTLRVLPASLREPVSLAYLLARAADTIADTRLLPPAERLRHLLAFRAQVQGPANAITLNQIELALTDKQSLPAERVLLQSLSEAFALLEAQPEADRARVRHVVTTLTRGMELDLNTFPAEDSGRLAALPNPVALENYIYYVAGCVGEFWTEITAAHAPALRGWDVKRLSETGVRFGKALQLTNVLRDVPRDLRIGRCYLPADELAAVGLRPEDLLKPETGDRARVVLVARLRVALQYYCSAEEYLLAIPRGSLRLRLAVLWPILIGLVTLGQLVRCRQWLHPDVVVRAGQLWVYWMLAVSVPCAFSDTLLKWWIGRLRRKVESAL